jgi:hypothetical protein
VRIDLKTTGTEEVQKMMAGMKRDAPKAVRLWANWIAIESQGETQKALPRHFTQRGTSDQFKRAIVMRAMTGSRGSAEVATGQGQGSTATQRFGSILARHEDANTSTSARTVTIAGKTLTGHYLPARGMRTTTRNPARSMYPLALSKLATSSRKGSKRKGTGESYFATDKGIFRRKHSGFGSAKPDALWWFKRTVRTPARLGLWENAQRVFNTRAIALGQQAVEEALFRMTL